jgi:hypothetical protein
MLVGNDFVIVFDKRKEFSSLVEMIVCCEKILFASLIKAKEKSN